MASMRYLRTLVDVFRRRGRFARGGELPEHRDRDVSVFVVSSGRVPPEVAAMFGDEVARRMNEPGGRAMRR